MMSRLLADNLSLENLFQKNQKKRGKSNVYREVYFFGHLITHSNKIFKYIDRAWTKIFLNGCFLIRRCCPYRLRY